MLLVHVGQRLRVDEDLVEVLDAAHAGGGLQRDRQLRDRAEVLDLVPILGGQHVHALHDASPGVLRLDHGLTPLSWVRAPQYPTVKRCRLCLGCSSSSTNAIAKSSIEIQLLPFASTSIWSPPSRNFPVRSPGANSAEGDRNVQSRSRSFRSTSRNLTPAVASAL